VKRRTTWLLASWGAMAAFGCAGEYVPVPEEDLTPPVVVKTFPAPDAAAVDPALKPVGAVTIEFSKPMDPATVTANSLRLNGPHGTPGTAVTLSEDGKNARLLLPAGAILPEDGRYTVVVSTSVTDDKGIPLGQSDYRFEFTVAVSPPAVVGMMPADGSTVAAADVPALKEVRVTFSEPLDPSSVSEVSVSVQGVRGTVALDKDGATVVFTAAEPFRQGRSYVVVLSPAIRDLQGIALGDEVRLQFNTGVKVPVVVSTSPGDDATEVPKALDRIAVTFDTAMDAASINSASFTVSDGLEGAVSYDPATMTASFAPAGGLEEGRTYTVTVSGAARSADGVPMGAPLVFSFTVAVDAPAIISSIPADGAADVRVDLAEMTIESSDNLAPETVSPFTFVVTPATGYRVKLAGGRTVTITFDGDLVSNITYAVSVSDFVADIFHNRMKAAAVIRFSTVPVPVDNNPPTAITDLRYRLDRTRDGNGVETLKRRSLVLEWTWPGADAEAGAPKGQVSSYEMRWSNAPFDATTFESATILSENPPAPKPAGTPEAFAVRTLPDGIGGSVPVRIGGTYHFMIRVSDGTSVAFSNLLAAAPGLDRVTAEGDAEGDWLGHSVAVLPAHTNGRPALAAGAPYAKDAAGVRTGAVHLYAGLPAGLGAGAIESLYGEGDGGMFGSALAALDLDGDGCTDLAVGAPRHGAGWPGRVYLFIQGTDAAVCTGFAAGRRLVVDGPGAGAFLGYSLAALPDIESDGTMDLAVGAPGAGADSAGQVIIVKGSRDSMLINTAGDLVTWGAAPAEWFGAAIDAGDLDGDGCRDLLVGAPGADAGGVDRGRAYVFAGPAPGGVCADFAATAAASAAWSIDGAADYDAFGTAVLAGADVDGDGMAEVVVGAPAATDDSGAVYIFKGQALLQTLAGTAGSRFGAALAAAGDMLADGCDGAAGACTDLAVGAPETVWQDGLRYGAVMLFFSGGSGTINPSVPAVIRGPHTFSAFGAALTATGDLDGDGLPDLAAGMPVYGRTARAAGGLEVLK